MTAIDMFFSCWQGFDDYQYYAGDQKTASALQYTGCWRDSWLRGDVNT